jgi:hypothetical protein
MPYLMNYGICMLQKISRQEEEEKEKEKKNSTVTRKQKIPTIV